MYTGTYCCIIKYLHFRFAILLVLSCACQKGVSMIMYVYATVPFTLHIYVCMYEVCSTHCVHEMESQHHLSRQSQFQLIDSSSSRTNHKALRLLSTPIKQSASSTLFAFCWFSEHRNQKQITLLGFMVIFTSKSFFTNIKPFSGLLLRTLEM